MQLSWKKPVQSIKWLENKNNEQQREDSAAKALSSA
jgi:hypothetical protein